MLLYALRWKCQQGGENFLGWVSGVWRRSAGLLCLWGATTRRAKPRRISLFLMGERPPASPFLNDQKGAKESVKEGDFDVPLLDNPPLKTTKHRGAAASLLDVPPRLSYRYATCIVGLLRNAAGARAQGRPETARWPPSFPMPNEKRALPMAAPAWRFLFDRPIVTGRKRRSYDHNGSDIKVLFDSFSYKKKNQHRP